MPFLHNQNKIEPLRKKWDKVSYKSGLRHAVINVNGDKYIGEWKNNKKDGKGALSTHSGTLYEGSWERGYRHGYGIMCKKTKDGNYATQFNGKWVNGKMKGVGISHFDDGSCYEGEWRNGKRHGYGRMFFADGSYYDGEWSNDEFNGVGMFVNVDGNRYEGEWICGQKQGPGRFFHLDSGQLQEGLWNNGIPIYSTMVDIYYRQSAINPTEYPIPELKLQDMNILKKHDIKILQKKPELDKSDSCIAI